MATSDVLRSLVDSVHLQSQSIERLRASVEELKNTLADSNQRLIATVEQMDIRLTASIERMDDRLGARIDALTVQVGSFAGAVNDVRSLMREISAEAKRQNETAKIQAENVQALIQLVREVAAK